MKYVNSLTKLGITPDQAKIYETLLSMATAPARLIAKKTGVGRELTYVVLGQLERMGLVERSTERKIILFKALHPRNIKIVLEQKREEVKTAEEAYQSVITAMVGDFNAAHAKPFIRFYEGLEGLQKTYDHILKFAKTVYVLRSLYDRENPQLRDMIVQQIEKQGEKGIRSYVLTPHLSHMQPEKTIHNTKRNVTRKLISKEKFVLPSQIIIYNNTVSITTMKKEIITTVIESEDIAKTFHTLFMYMWDIEQ